MKHLKPLNNKARILEQAAAEDRVADVMAPPPGKIEGTGRAGWLIDHAPINGYILTNRLLAAGVKNLRVIHLPTPSHAIASLMPATCATQVLHFCARHDGIACHEP